MRYLKKKLSCDKFCYYKNNKRSRIRVLSTLHIALEGQVTSIWDQERAKIKHEVLAAGLATSDYCT